MTGFHPLVLPDCRESSYCEANPYVSPYTIDGIRWCFTFVICPRDEAISSNVGKSPPIPNVCPQVWKAKASVLPRQNSGTFSEAIGEFARAIVPPRPNGNNLPRPKPVPTPTPALLRTLPFASSVRLIRDRSRYPWPRPQARFPDMS